MSVTVAALYVAPGGCYYGLPDVIPYGLPERDARLYAGPWPVIAHPDCARWCQLARTNQSRYGHKVGDDDGQFEAALGAVRRWGGVLEHPALSLAWKAYGLPRPSPEGWTWVGPGELVTEVSQRNYGHRARKATWLLVSNIEESSFLSRFRLSWGPGPAPEAWISADRPRAELAALGIAQLSKREAKATPLEFALLLLSIARSARAREAA